MVTSFALDTPFRVLSSLPGRVRWAVPTILKRRQAAAALERELKGRPDVREVKASPVSGGVLLRFAEAEPLEVAEGWLRTALARLPADEAPSAPAAPGSTSTAL